MLARTHHHIQPVLAQPFHHGRCAGRIIGAIAIDQHIDAGIDIRKHPAHDMPFTLVALPANGGACGARNGDSVIAAIVVLDVDVRGWQRPAKVGYNAGDGPGFVVTRDQDGDFGVQAFFRFHKRGYTAVGEGER